MTLADAQTQAVSRLAAALPARWPERGPKYRRVRVRAYPSHVDEKNIRQTATGNGWHVLVAAGGRDDATLGNTYTGTRLAIYVLTRADAAISDDQEVALIDAVIAPLRELWRAQSTDVAIAELSVRAVNWSDRVKDMGCRLWALTCVWPDLSRSRAGTVDDGLWGRVDTWLTPSIDAALGAAANPEQRVLRRGLTPHDRGVLLRGGGPLPFVCVYHEDGTVVPDTGRRVYTDADDAPWEQHIAGVLTWPVRVEVWAEFGAGGLLESLLVALTARTWEDLGESREPRVTAVESPAYRPHRGAEMAAATIEMQAFVRRGSRTAMKRWVPRNPVADPDSLCVRTEWRCRNGE